jgi:hypothetical protein
VQAEFIHTASVPVIKVKADLAKVLKGANINEQLRILNLDITFDNPLESRSQADAL